MTRWTASAGSFSLEPDRGLVATQGQTLLDAIPAYGRYSRCIDGYGDVRALCELASVRASPPVQLIPNTRTLFPLQGPRATLLRRGDGVHCTASTGLEFPSFAPVHRAVVRFRVPIWALSPAARAESGRGSQPCALHISILILKPTTSRLRS